MGLKHEVPSDCLMQCPLFQEDKISLSEMFVAYDSLRIFIDIILSFRTICNLDGDEDETEHADDEFSTINFADLNDDNIDTSVVPIQTQNSVPESNPRPRSHAKFGGVRILLLLRGFYACKLIFFLCCV